MIFAVGLFAHKEFGAFEYWNQICPVHTDWDEIIERTIFIRRCNHAS